MLREVCEVSECVCVCVWCVCESVGLCLWSLCVLCAERESVCVRDEECCGVCVVVRVEELCVCAAVRVECVCVCGGCESERDRK